MARTTRYPERYRRQDRAPAFMVYQPRLPVSIGRDCGDILPGKEGTILSHLDNRGDGEYFLDPDLFMHGQENVTHLIWLRDSWQRFEVLFALHGGFMSAEDVEAST
jgi:hypothetical protein